MEPEVIESEIVLPTHFSFKKTQMYEKYPKGQARGRHWKHLKQIIQAENYQNYPPNEPNYVGPKLKMKKVVFRSLKTENSTHGDSTINEFPVSEFGPSIPSPSLLTKSSAPPNGRTFIPDVNIESPPSMHPCKRICDITGFEAPYLDPRTSLRYANADVFKLIRSLPNEYVQRYLALRNAAVVLK